MRLDRLHWTNFQFDEYDFVDPWSVTFDRRGTGDKLRNSLGWGDELYDTEYDSFYWWIEQCPGGQTSFSLNLYKQLFEKSSRWCI